MKGWFPIQETIPENMPNAGRQALCCENPGFAFGSCDGSFGKFSDLPERMILKCESSTPFDGRVLSETFAVAFHGPPKIKLDDGYLLIIGPGPER